MNITLKHYATSNSRRKHFGYVFGYSAVYSMVYGIPCKNMAVEGKKLKFGEVLEAIKEEEDLSRQLGSEVTAMISHSGGAILGFENGKVIDVVVGESITITDLASEDGGHTERVTCLAITPDGSRVVSGSEDKTVRVYNLEERREEGKFEGHTENITCLTITRDGSRVVSGSEDKTVRVYNVSERREESKFEGYTDYVTCLSITPDGSRAVSGSRDKTVRVYNLAEQTEESKFEGHSDRVKCLSITPDGSRVVSGSEDKTVRVYNISDRREECKFEGHTDYVTCLSITPDGLRVVSGSEDKTVRVYHLAERREESKFEGHTKTVTCLSITPDGSRVVSGSKDKTVRVYNISERREESKFERHTDWVTCLAITLDGLRVVSGSEDKTVRAYILSERREESKIEGHSSIVWCLAITPDGSRVVLGSKDKTVRIYNIAERREESKFEGLTFTVYCLAITPDGSRVVLGSDDMTVRVYNLAEWREEFKFEGHTDEIRCLKITPDGLRAVSGSEDKTVRIYNLAERREEAKFEGHTDAVNCLAITPDGLRVVSSSYYGEIRVYNLAELKEESKFEGHTDRIKCLAITPDGLRVVSGSNNGEIQVYNFAMRSEEFMFKGHTEQVTCLAITPNGSRIVFGSYCGEIRVYNLAERREEAKFEGHTDLVWCLAITPDGSTIVSGSYDRTVRINNISDSIFDQRPSEAITPSQQTFKSNQLHSTPSDLKYAIELWKKGCPITSHIAKCIHPVHFFNALHIFAYYNHYNCLLSHLKDGVPLIRGVFGSPLTLALQRNAIKCTDAILRHFIDLITSGFDCWAQFKVIIEDLPDLLTCPSSLLESLFGLLMYAPEYLDPLPDFIAPILVLPATMHISSRLIGVSDFHNDTKSPDVLVKFHLSLPRWNFTAGSNESISMLSAFENCENKLVLVSPYVSTVIEEKWSHFYLFTLSVTFAYFLLLANICCLLYIDWDSFYFLASFLFLNACFIMYEVAQYVAMENQYFADYWNWLDGVRAGLSILWACCLLQGCDPVKSENMKRLTLVVVVLCFIRGFTYFRSFKMTRIFVYMTLAVVKEMYSFLFILGYSVLAFGIFSSVLLEMDTIGDAWTSAYNLLMGNFDNSSYRTVEWVVFTGATVTNVVIMLNLLVSILGEAYEKTQMSVRENDLHQQLSVILEYESIMFWRRKDRSPGTIIVTCKKADDAGEALEWSGQILQITHTIQTALENHFIKTEEKATGLEEKVGGLEGKVDGLEGKIDARVTGLEGKIDEKVARLEDQLQAILGLLQARS